MTRSNYRKQPRQATRPAINQVVMVPRIFGYARVSTEDQILDVQIQALKLAGCVRIFSEKASAKNLHRPEFRLMLKQIEKGDTIIVHAFSRISRNLKELLGFIDDMEALGVDIISTSEPYIKPFTTFGRNMVSQMGALDEFERNRAKDRTKDAMQEKKRQGMAMGRTPLIDGDDKKLVQSMRNAGVQAPVIASKFGIAISTVYANTKPRAHKRRAA